MQYSVVNGVKTEVQPNLEGLCACCNKPTYSACGKFNVWHWRHKNKVECDDWWEAETEWHREWKSNFPVAWREVIQHDIKSGEKHIADVKTEKDIVLEFQNSPIKLDELKSRERFYEKMIWIVNALPFKENFKLGYKLPDPKSKFPRNYKFLGYKHVMVYNTIKYPQSERWAELLHKIDNIPLKELIDKYHTRHFTFSWKKARQVWLEAQKPVFFDFNDEAVWRIQVNTAFSSEPICSRYSKSELLKKYNQK